MPVLSSRQKKRRSADWETEAGGKRSRFVGGNLGWPSRENEDLIEKVGGKPYRWGWGKAAQAIGQRRGIIRLADSEATSRRRRIVILF